MAKAGNFYKNINAELGVDILESNFILFIISNS